MNDKKESIEKALNFVKEHKSEIMEIIKNGSIGKLIGVSPDDLELK